MPVYNWERMAVGDFSWLRDRAKRSADLYDGYRVDHVVGFYRAYGRPRDGGEGSFTPSEEGAQVALGERVLRILQEPGSEIIAEDLGIVPDFVRRSLARSGVPGFCVFRWERFWYDEGQPFKDPAEYPSLSVAATGTHDTETLAVWWDELPPDDREKVDALQTIRKIAGGRGIGGGPFDPMVRDILLEAVLASASDLALVPVQDVFGWRDRINEPGTVTPENWTFRLPWLCDRLDEIPEARERQRRLRDWSEKHSRRYR
jgi:4-alpha-glucanotransferase